ncbi:type II toxin-antitoxin system RelE/ParE family toxin [Pinisolibacter aquiterrae]|uniref:type II toxin-antitoxin system RelE/ParE family toxin n=1 Tax=Pinisolibacter aquiterrae TaxID=2815579 RepID=UPI001C3E20EE|nr:type II toxin-antitoxin system RelE/ParE family toxin [Pinisolibacter aquiterrae]MCC8237046.1 type II toxin-antitoxin system RelE/ParE family toxin [Pinisolibacter aquiterrae]
MTRTIRWTVRAVRRLDQVGAFIARDDPRAAARVVARIVSGVELLAEQPALGRVGRVPGTRELVFADVPYIVPYRVGMDTVEILTVMHTAQKWPEGL